MINNKKQIKVTLKKSLSGRLPKHLETLRCLGLKRINQSVILNFNPATKGMINQVSYMVAVEDC